MRTTTLTGALLAALVAPASAQPRITQADLLRRLIDLDRLMTPPAGERSGMFSSYDRRSRIDADGNYVDWAANADRGQFIRAEADGWQVMAEMKGPGALTRIWSANPHGQIRFILDGDTVIDARFENLFDKRLPPFDEPLCYVTPGGGHTCYFPIGYGRSCKVVIRGSSSYYQINYVSFPPGTGAEAFRPELDAEARAALDEVGDALIHGLSERQLFGDRPAPPVGSYEKLRPGETIEIETYGGGGVIRALYVGLADRPLPPAPYALHRCVLRVYLDGEERPSVEAPLVDFFGSGFELQSYNSLVVGTDERTSMPGRAPKNGLITGAGTGTPEPGEVAREGRFMYCYFPMPFNDSARVAIQNLSNQKIGLTLWAKVERTPPPAGSLRFKARFRREDPCTVFDYPILEAAGRGRIVGCTLNVDCPRRAWWGEGDDKVWIDGETFPSYFGTGSEDYLGDAWGRHLHTNALQGVTRSGPYGKNSSYRWHISDCINFQQSVRFTIENWQHDNARDTYYGTVVYWYGQPQAADFFEPLTLADLTPPGLRIPGAVEIEDHIVGAGWGYPLRERHAGGSELSGQKAAAVSGGGPVQINIPADRERVVRLKLRVHPRRSFEDIEVVDAAGRTVGTVRYRRTTDGIHTVGVIRLQRGDNRVTVRCTPKAILDCWILEDVPTSGRGPEGEDLEVVSAGNAATSIEYATLDWSGGAQRVVDFARVGDALKFALPASQEERLCRLRLVITRGPAGGRFQTLIDDQPLGEPFDTFGPEPEIERVDIAVVSLAPGAHTLAFRAERNPSKSAGLRLGLDTVEFVPVASRHAIECETLPIVGSRDSHHGEQTIGGASGEAHIWCRPTEPGAWIEFEVPVEKAGRYKLAIVYTTSFDYGIVQTYVNGEKAGEPFDTFGSLQPGPIRPLGEFELPAGPLRVKCEVLGKNDRSAGYYFGVDCIVVEPDGQ